MDHIPVCAKLEPYRRTVLKLLDAVGCDAAKIHPTVTWLLGVTWDDDPRKCAPLSELERAILILSWRVLYRHMTLLDLGKTRKIKLKSVRKDLGRVLMDRILAFQQEKQNFYLLNVCAGQHPNSNMSRAHIPEKTICKVSQLGKLNDHTGELIVKPTLRKALRSLGAWKKFGTHKNAGRNHTR